VTNKTRLTDQQEFINSLGMTDKFEQWSARKNQLPTVNLAITPRRLLDLLDSTAEPLPFLAAPLEDVPETVIEIFNTLILDVCFQGRATVLQKSVEALILQEYPNLTLGDIRDRKWLNVESHFRNQGWDVRYDRPANYGGDSSEDYDAYYEFSFKSARPGRT
jgi:hypothetical protein